MTPSGHLSIRSSLPCRLLAALLCFSVVLCSITARSEPSVPGSASLDVGGDSLPPFRLTSVHQWIVDWMTSVSPVGVTYVKDAKETEEEGLRRYEQIADDVISVAYDQREKPLFGGKYGRAMTAALMVSIAFNESSFRKDVDLGLGPKARGDSGKSWCLMQVMMGKPAVDGRTKTRVLFDGFGVRFLSDSAAPSGWGGEDLVQDRTKCFRTGIRLVRMSFNACWRLPVEDRLAQYTSGDGSCTLGRDASEIRVKQAQRWLAKRRPPLTDAEAIGVLQPMPLMPLPLFPSGDLSISDRIIPGIAPI